MELERVESGIPGLDKLIEGGFVKGSVNLISGGTGTGKTIFGCQFIWHGLQKGEKGVHISLEESVNSIKRQAVQLGMDFDKYIEQRQCSIEYVFPKTFDKFYNEIFKKIRAIDAERVVLDSITLLALYQKSTDIFLLREKIYDLLQKLKEWGVTSLVISEVADEKSLSKFGFEEYVVDSVIILHYLEYAAGGVPWSLVIRKMRNTRHGADVYPFEITKKGIVVRKP